MADNVLTPEFRGTFVAILRPSAGKNDDGTPGKLKYSIRAAFPPNSDLSVLKTAAAEAAKAKWGEKIPKVLRSPFRTYGELDKEFPGIDEDWILMTFSTNAEHRPGVVDANLNDIIDEADVYSGAWFRAQVRASAYENAGNRGVTFYLQNVQKIKDGEPLGGAKTPANKAFEAVGGGAKTAGSLFD